MKPFVLYGWNLSYFSGKARCYLQYKGVEFVDQPVNLYTLMRTIKRKTGVVVMPVLRTPEDEWIQDTSVIIDRMEARFPERPVLPATPVQRFAAYVMEAWGDEWWIPMAMHTRWNYPENYALFEREGGAALLPGFPGFVQRRAVAIAAKAMRSKLDAVGARPAQFAMLNAWLHDMLDLLDAHFSCQPYLLGERPTLADFALVGSMYGHLGRDPWPAREMVAPRKHLRAWIDRMAAAPTQAAQSGALLPHDAIAPTLQAVFARVFAEFLPLLQGISAQVQALAPAWPAGKPLPRGLQDVAMPLGAHTFRRTGLPYTLWMAQRCRDIYHAMSPPERAAVAAWLHSLGGEALLTMHIPRLERRGLRVALA